MIDIDQYISDFIRDAQYRIALLAMDMDKGDSWDSVEYIDLENKIHSLYRYMDILYVGNWYIVDGYNHLVDWTDKDIMAEAEYLRAYTGMITSPFISFVGNYPQIVESISNQNISGTGLPFGNEGDFILYDDNNIPKTVKFPTIVGNVDNESAVIYFS